MSLPRSVLPFAVRESGSSAAAGLAVRTQSVPALEKSFYILELIAQSKAGLTLLDLVTSTGLPKSSVHCILLTLQRLGYLHRNARTSRFLFGMKLVTLANTGLQGIKLREQSLRYLQSLARSTGLTAHLAILEQCEPVIVAKAEAPGVVPVSTWVGKRIAVHCTALGKALLAGSSEEEVAQVIRHHGLPRHNENTLYSPVRLKLDLEMVRRRGHSIDDEEDEIGIRCVGAPIYDSDHRMVAAVSLSGSTSHIREDNIEELARRVKQTGNCISQAIEEESGPRGRPESTLNRVMAARGSSNP